MSKIWWWPYDLFERYPHYRKSPILQMFREVVQEVTPEAKYLVWFDHLGNPVGEIIDLPRYIGVHGSSIGLKCNETHNWNSCDVSGDIIVNPGIVKDFIKEIKTFNCNIEAVHKHKLITEEHHIHIECKDLPIQKVRKLLEFIRWF